MSGMAGLHGGWLGINIAANLLIVFGYALVPFTVLRHLKLKTPLRVAGLLFFGTCAITHMSMAFQFSESRWMVVNHAVQCVAVIWFVLGFWAALTTQTPITIITDDEKGE